MAPKAVTACFASSWKTLGKMARKVWLFPEVLVMAKMRFP